MKECIKEHWKLGTLLHGNIHTLDRLRAADGLCAAEELYADGLNAAELYLMEQENST